MVLTEKLDSDWKAIQTLLAHKTPKSERKAEPEKPKVSCDVKDCTAMILGGIAVNPGVGKSFCMWSFMKPSLFPTVARSSYKALNVQILYVGITRSD